MIEVILILLPLLIPVTILQWVNLVSRESERQLRYLEQFALISVCYAQQAYKHTDAIQRKKIAANTIEKLFIENGIKNPSMETIETAIEAAVFSINLRIRRQETDENPLAPPHMDNRYA